MMAWWANLEARERLLVAAGGTVLALVLAWLLIIEPLLDARQAQREQLQARRATLAFIESLDPATVAPRGQADRQGRSLLGLVDHTVRAAGLAAAIERLEPADSESVRIWLQGADYAALMDWVVTLSRDYGVTLESAQVNAAAAPGQVTARLQFRERG